MYKYLNHILVVYCLAPGHQSLEHLTANSKLAVVDVLTRNSKYFVVPRL